MRRRTKRGPNDSESTGKIGQELPAGQVAPLRPAYPDAESASQATPKSPAQPPAKATPVAKKQAETASSGNGETHGEDRSGARSSRGRRRRGGRGRRGGTRAPGTGTGEPLADDLDATAPGYDAEADAYADPDADEDESGEAEPSLDAGPGKLVHETQPDSTSTPPPAPQPAGGPRQPRGFVVLTIGLPGSGKTTWFKRRAVTPLSSDMLRGILFDDITEQRYQGLVFSTLRSLLRARLIAKMPWNYVDATNLSPHERRQWIKMARSFGYEVHAVFFDVPFEVCMERNRRRERVVSEDVMEKMAERLRAPSFREGFSKITVVRVKGVAGSMTPGSLGKDEAPDDTTPFNDEPEFGQE